MAKQSNIVAQFREVLAGQRVSVTQPDCIYVIKSGETYQHGINSDTLEQYNAFKATLSPQTRLTIIHEAKTYAVQEPPVINGHGIVLTLKQTLALDYLESGQITEVLYGGALGGGKSALGCYWALKECLRYPGIRVLVGRVVLKTLKETTLKTLFEIAGKLGLKANADFRYNAISGMITFNNGSEILLKDLASLPSDPNHDELGSLEITLAFIDEANQVTEKCKSVVRSRIRFKLTEYKLSPRLLLTCNPAKNFVYTDFYKPWKDGKLAPKRQFIQSFISDNKHLSNEYKADLLSLDENMRSRLVEGNWEYISEATALIPHECILSCFSNSHIGDGERVITVDVARFGRDSTVIIVWFGFRAKIYQYRKYSTVQTSEEVKRLAELHNVSTGNILTDEDGVGGGIVDQLGCQGFVNNSRPLANPITRLPENYDNLKSQCYYRFANRVNSGALFIDCADDPEMREAIIEEMGQVKQFNMDKDGKKQIIPKVLVKAAIGRSPDFTDALMMREWFELSNRFTWVAF